MARRSWSREPFEDVLSEERPILPVGSLAQVVNEVSDEVVGLGPLERLLEGPEVSEGLVVKRGRQGKQPKLAPMAHLETPGKPRPAYPGPGTRVVRVPHSA